MTAWADRLLHWFRINSRPMPWRDDPSPYKVWVSEIMLQQTQVATVIPYFERFTKRFPNVQTLAEADPQDVLKHWEGLGYYSRARNLQAAAQRIAGDLNGCFPTSAADWKTLPGIGDYTGAAIASITRGEPVPAIDGNVLRVMSRLLGIRKTVTLPAVRETIRARLIPPLKTAHPATFNQALMELGALVCRPKNPICDDCPLNADCIAFRKGLTRLIPVKAAKAAIPMHTEIAAIISHSDRFLLYRRPEKGLLGGMWEFPGARREGRDALHKTLLRGIAEKTGLHVDSIRRRGIVKHTFSHFSQTIHVYTCETDSATVKADLPGSEKRWCTRQEIAALPLSKAQRTIAGLIPK